MIIIGSTVGWMKLGWQTPLDTSSRSDHPSRIAFDRSLPRVDSRIGRQAPIYCPGRSALRCLAVVHHPRGGGSGDTDVAFRSTDRANARAAGDRPFCGAYPRLVLAKHTFMEVS